MLDGDWSSDVCSSDLDQRAALMAQVCEELSAAPVQHIGNILILFREKPQEEVAPEVRPTPRKPLARKPMSGAKPAAKPLSKIKSAKTGQRRKIEYGQLRNTRTKPARRASGIR
jgi:hypothetical protein